jgi:hypothetical protein
MQITSPSRRTAVIKFACQHKPWLQRNRIDDAGLQRNVGGMKQIELKSVTGSALHLCQQCGHPMRLIGSEPHPIASGSDLLTYCCTRCEQFLVLPTEGSAKTNFGALN